MERINGISVWFIPGEEGDPTLFPMVRIDRPDRCGYFYGVGEQSLGRLSGCASSIFAWHKAHYPDAEGIRYKNLGPRGWSVWAKCPISQ